VMLGILHFQYGVMAMVGMLVNILMDKI